eukprot:1698221-Prorocentrum_lima.AAC.1
MGPRTRSCHLRSSLGASLGWSSPVRCLCAARRCWLQDPPVLAACAAVMWGSVAAARDAAVSAAKTRRRVVGSWRGRRLEG